MIILKLFAKKDYENLSDYKKSLLKEERSKLAKKLLKEREKTKKLLGDLEGKAEYLNQEDLKKYVSGDRRTLEDINKADLDRKAKINTVRKDKYNKILDSYKKKKNIIKNSIESLKEETPTEITTVRKAIETTNNKLPKKFLNKKLLKYGGGSLLLATGTGLGVKLYRNHKENSKKDLMKKKLSGNNK